ncbi:hypothetical protein GOBAR_DD06555 [Gossypium barbadense]|nr:hypothetical protein GOBAR_DD06555 [Gossypium barbadense]
MSAQYSPYQNVSAQQNYSNRQAHQGPYHNLTVQQSPYPLNSQQGPYANFNAPPSAYHNYSAQQGSNPYGSRSYKALSWKCGEVESGLKFYTGDSCFLVEGAKSSSILSHGPYGGADVEARRCGTYGGVRVCAYGGSCVRSSLVAAP